MGDPVDPSAGLPKDAPADLRAFLNCTGASVTIKDGKLSWAAGSPTITISPDSTTSATVTFSKSVLSVSVPVSIANGQLSLDLSGYPDAIASEVRQAIDVDNLNAWFKKNGQQLGPASFGKGQVTLKKVPIPSIAATPPVGLGGQAAPQGKAAAPQGQAAPQGKAAGPQGQGGQAGPPQGQGPQGQGPKAPPAPNGGTLPAGEKPKSVRIATAGVPGVKVEDIFNVPSTDPPPARGGTSGPSPSGTRTVPPDSAPVRTGTSGAYIQRAAGPEDGSPPPRNEVTLPPEFGGEPPSTILSGAAAVGAGSVAAPPGTAPSQGQSRSLIGVGGLLIVGVIAVILSTGGGLLASAQATPTPPVPQGGLVGLPELSAKPTETVRPGGGPGGPGGSGEVTAPPPIATQPPPPQFVIIAGNTITFGPEALLDQQKACKDGWTVTITVRIAGIPKGTPVVVQASGPGVPPSLTFIADPDVNEAQSFAFGPGGGSWADHIVTIGGKAPPTSGATAATVFQC
ncbi:MAG TPA: hypothetical protein VKR30_09960 [Candidatus Limnocylindrales bacterium]|nr:hypothetical protein [Candidatus Limnocylindrales bacterium]